MLDGPLRRVEPYDLLEGLLRDGAEGAVRRAEGMDRM